jgi:DNA-binding CsgD family transcriptional regulator
MAPADDENEQFINALFTAAGVGTAAGVASKLLKGGKPPPASARGSTPKPPKGPPAPVSSTPKPPPVRMGFGGGKLPEGYKKSLAVVHNLSEANLLHADEIGGLAAPSLAVIDSDKGAMTGFGEVSLLADPNILKSGGIRTFDSDVYSPRHPRPEYKITDKKMMDFRDFINKETEGLGDLRAVDWDSASREGPSALARNDQVRAAFLKSRGELPARLPRKKMPEDLGPEHAKAARIKNIDQERWQLRDDPELKSMATAYYDGQLVKLREADPELASRLEDKFFETAEDGSRQITRNYADRFAQDAKRAKAALSGEVDTIELSSMMSKKLRSKSLSDALDGYVSQISSNLFGERRLYKGMTDSGNRRYSPYTMENILREMTKTIRGGENWHYGAGSIRAKYARELKSLDDIRGSKDKLVASGGMEDAKKAIQDKLSDLIFTHLERYYRFSGGNRFSAMDEMSKAIAEGPKGIREVFDFKGNPEPMQRIQEFIDELKSMPTEYFEAKANRAVGLNEFAVAIVPRGASPKTIDALKRAGLKIKYYTKGDEASRAKAIQSEKQYLAGISGNPEAIGAGLGTVAGGTLNLTDANGDGVIDDADRMLNAAGGALSATVGVGAGRAVARRFSSKGEFGDLGPPLTGDELTNAMKPKPKTAVPTFTRDGNRLGGAPKPPPMRGPDQGTFGGGDKPPGGPKTPPSNVTPIGKKAGKPPEPPKPLYSPLEQGQWVEEDPFVTLTRQIEESGLSVKADPDEYYRPFSMDNTNGYSQSDLDLLNKATETLARHNGISKTEAAELVERNWQSEGNSVETLSGIKTVLPFPTRARPKPPVQNGFAGGKAESRPKPPTGNRLDDSAGVGQSDGMVISKPLPYAFQRRAYFEKAKDYGGGQTGIVYGVQSSPSARPLAVRIQSMDGEPDLPKGIFEVNWSYLDDFMKSSDSDLPSLDVDQYLKTSDVKNNVHTAASDFKAVVEALRQDAQQRGVRGYIFEAAQEANRARSSRHNIYQMLIKRYAPDATVSEWRGRTFVEFYSDPNKFNVASTYVDDQMRPFRPDEIGAELQQRLSDNLNTKPSAPALKSGGGSVQGPTTSVPVTRKPPAQAGFGRSPTGNRLGKPKPPPKGQQTGNALAGKPKPVEARRAAPRGNNPFRDPRLSPGENKTAEMLLNGYGYDEIADEMMTSRDVVKKQASVAQQKLGTDVRLPLPGMGKRPPGSTKKDAAEALFEDADARGENPDHHAIAQRIGIPVGTVKSYKTYWRQKKNAPVASAEGAMYNPPAMPERPFEADYPQSKWPDGPPVDAQGRLTRDMDRRPLDQTSAIIGRNKAPGYGPKSEADRSLRDRIAVIQTLKKAGSSLERVPRSPDKANGSWAPTFDANGRLTGRSSVQIADDLDRPIVGLDDQEVTTLSHELAHSIDFKGGPAALRARNPNAYNNREWGIDHTGHRPEARAEIESQLERIYTDLNNPVDGEVRIRTPKDHGYEAIDADRELWAEAIRAYMYDPNYIKTVAPEVAFMIRDHVNRSKSLRKTIQFNAVPTVVGLGGLGLGAAALSAPPAEAQKR